MILRGITFNGAPYMFNIEECPVLLNENTMALVNKKFSPLIRPSSIVLGNEETGLFEGDYVIDSHSHKLIGNIIYDRGFRILLLDSGRIINVEDADSFYTTVNAKFCNQENIYKYHPDILFKANGMIFTLDKLVCVNGDKLVVYLKLLEGIYIRDIRLCTGIIKRNIPIAYGDMFDGGIVVLKDNVPMVKTKNGFKEIVA